MKDLLPYIPGFINDAMKSLGFFMPEIVLTIGFILVVITDAFSAKKSNGPFYLTLISLVVAGVFTIQQLQYKSTELFSGMLISDHSGVLFKLVFLMVGLIFILFLKNNRDFNSHAKGTGDACSIFLAVLLGMNLMAMSSNLLMIFISIEMVSIGSYLMVGYISKDNRQTEAAVKYVIFGAVCSAIMLYGLSLIYGLTGTLNLSSPELIRGLSEVPPLVSGVIIILVLVGIGFKLSVVPFHFWSPDVYEGAPTPVTAFLSTGPKAAGFAILIRFLTPLQNGDSTQLDNLLFNFNAILAVAAMASMVIGNFGAIWQNNIKRMLAYSSIGHTGFLLMAIIAFSAAGFKALMFYIVIYAIMNMAAFILANEVEELTGSEEADDYKGLGKQFPLLMVCFVIVLVSLTGLPPTAGFTAKFLIFSSALDSYNASGSVWLLLLMITGAVTTVVSLFYYFKIPLNAFLKARETPYGLVKYTSMKPIWIILSVLLIVLLFVPGIIISFL
ncbi:MAG TPA: NADH-quinone oxidoreductase subunit N [Sphingobacteriaceae bacterium]